MGEDLKIVCPRGGECGYAIEAKLLEGGAQVDFAIYQTTVSHHVSGSSERVFLQRHSSEWEPSLKDAEVVLSGMVRFDGSSFWTSPEGFYGDQADLRGLFDAVLGCFETAKEMISPIHQSS